MKEISSPHNDAVKRLARYMEHTRDRRRDGLLVLEGLHLLQAALAAGWGVEGVFFNRQALEHPEVQALLASLPEGCQPAVLSEGALGRISALSSAPELVALCRRPPARAAQAGRDWLLLEDIQDPGNLGTILRSAAAAGVRDVLLSRGCAEVYSPKVLRAGMGAHFALNLQENADLVAALQAYRGRKLVTHLEGSSSLYGVDLTGPVAFVMGNEGAGVSAGLLAEADCRVRIPMPGTAESLNVAMAATLCLFEQVRQREGLRQHA